MKTMFHKVDIEQGALAKRLGLTIEFDMADYQVRAARALLSWSAEELAKQSGVSVSTIRRIEKGGSSISSVATAIHRTFERAGVEFTERGVLLRAEPGNALSALVNEES
jgi:transcriptional regulator with XRE-family HTH domain